jgi:hypothetical protein
MARHVLCSWSKRRKKIHIYCSKPLKVYNTIGQKGMLYFNPFKVLFYVNGVVKGI